MILAALVIMLLPHQGYWFGGQPEQIAIRHAVPQQTPAADLVWNLMFGTVRLCGGEIPLHSEDETTLQVTPPIVRTRIAASLVYHIQEHNGGKSLEDGNLSIQLFPSNLLKDVGERLKGKKLAVWDSSQVLNDVLRSANVKFTDLKGASGPGLDRYDILLVGSDQIGTSLFVQQPLMAQARAGASVMVLVQHNDQANLFGYAVIKRKMPPRLNWRMDHPLLAGFEQADVASWLRDSPDAWALRLPSDEPALEIAWWPREVPGAEPVPLDALLISKSIGSGRIVLCQLPLGDWRTDPRSQIMLANTLDYLLSRPEPTLRPSQRPATLPAAARNENRIPLPGE